MRNYPMYIGGEFTSGSGQTLMNILNPASAELIAQVPQATRADMQAAIAAAREAFDKGPWRQSTGIQRATVLFKIAAALRARAAELAELETLNMGKPIFESEYDLADAATCFEYFGGWATKVFGEVNPVPDNAVSMTMKEPVGVCGLIIPWNYPLLMAAWKLAPALAAGNCVVLKPAEQTPLTALRLGEIFRQAGVPDGVVNILTGDGSTGAALVRHPGVDKIAFTGSTEVGREVMINAAGSLKRLSLELGGKAPNVVFADANLEQAVNGALFAIYFNQGQICTAGSRLFVQASIYDQFVERLTAKVAQLRVGDPTLNTTQIGALVSPEQYEKVCRYIEIGQQEGATLAAGGQSLRDQLGGYFVQPTIFTGVHNAMRIAQEEIFGPVLSVIPFADEDEAARLVNEIPYGLVSAVWTENVRRAHNFARRIQAGYVWINTYNMLPVEAPFGGYKQSGFGRELGFGALDLYTETKNVYIELNEASPITGWYGV
jgi:acyl-CoA reductase-like NAD-dependent aldehyde dehydrogenase